MSECKQEKVWWILKPRCRLGGRRIRGQSGNARALSWHGVGFSEIRGSRYNSGEVLNFALGLGAQPIGHWSGCHAVLVDAEAPDVECAYEHRYSYPYGIMVDINGKRFVDEGEDFFSYTYAKCGREVLALAVAHGIPNFRQQDPAAAALGVQPRLSCLCG